MAGSIVNSHVPIMPWHSETITPKMQSAVPQSAPSSCDIAQAVTPWRLTTDWSSGHLCLLWWFPVVAPQDTPNNLFATTTHQQLLKYVNQRVGETQLLKHGLPQGRYESESREELMFRCQVIFQDRLQMATVLTFAQDRAF